MLTAAVRDLHVANPGQFQTDVRTSADALWEHNPHLTRLSEGTPGVETLDMHYPLVHQSNQRPYHFIHGYPQYLEERLGVRVPVSQFRGDVHLSAAERSSPPLDGHPLPECYWIIVAGGKYDFTAKWWDPTSYQKVIDNFLGRIAFVQVGESGHWHKPLTGVVNLIGKTNTRQFVRLMYHAEGVVCPVTFAMHLAAAVETRPGRPKQRPCVVIAGGREPTQWEAYPHHQYIGTVGLLSCCQEGGCWKSRCQLVGDGDSKDRSDLCEQPVQLTKELRIPRCMDMISAEDVIRRIEMCCERGMLKSQNSIVTKNGASPTHTVPPQQSKPHSTLTGSNAKEVIMWEAIPGLAREITVGADGSVWCLGMGDSPNGYSIHRWAGNDWDHVDGAAAKIAAGPGGQAWVIGREHQIFAYESNGWVVRPGLAREIAVGGDGSIWCLCSVDIAPGGGSIHAWNGQDWDHVEGAAVKIAVGSDGQPWIVNSAGQIFRRSGEGWELLPGLAQELALGPDGTVWCLSKGMLPEGGHSVHRWNGTDWDHVQGSAIKIAAGPEGTVFIVNPEHAILRIAATA